MATTTSIQHAGSKRKPEGIGDQDRLAKRFDLLNINSNHKHYLPTPSDDQQQQDAPACIAANAGDPSSGALMQVEDTRDRVFIHDLDAELAALESDSDRPVFLPDIEKHLNKIPHQLLRTTASTPADKQLVLYHVPKSVSLPADDDSVRRAILEARNRARLEQRERARRERRGEDMELERGNGERQAVLARLRWRDPPEDDRWNEADDEGEGVDDADAMDIS